MASKQARFHMIANQMMKGCNGTVERNNVASTKPQMEDFKRVYAETINYVNETIPRTMSAALCGALGKAILWYGKKEIEPFVQAIANREYKGPTDPCHVLWEWLIRNGERNPKDIYRRTVTAIRMFIRKSQIRSHLKPALDDIFEWQDNYRVMYQPKRNQYTKNSSKSITKQADCAILADVDDAVSGSPS